MILPAYNILRRRRIVAIPSVDEGMTMYTNAETSISLYFRGDSGAQFTLDWGHGTPELVTLNGLGSWVIKSHDYTGSGAGNKTIRITDDPANIKWYYTPPTVSVTMSGLISELAKMSINFINIQGSGFSGNILILNNWINATNIYIGYMALTGNLNVFANMPSLVNLSILGGNFTYISPIGGWPTFSGDVYDLRSCISTSTEVDNLIIDADSAGWNNLTLYLGGTNPSRTSASNDAYNSLVANNVTFDIS